MKNDGILYDQKFNISHYVDEKLKDPNLKLKFGNNEFTMAEINNIIPSKEKKIDLFIEWDNMCQYTAIGLVSLLNELIKENRSIDIKKFMERDEYPNGIDYVKNVIFSDLKPELIDKAIEKYYTKIMAKSPVTDFFQKLNLMKFMLNSVTFMFRYNIPGLSAFVDEISEDKFNHEIDCRFCVYTSEEMEIEAIKRFPIKELYVVPDMGLYYHTMMENKKECTNILSYVHHNGINPMILSYYFNDFINVGLEGPNNISLNFIHELKIKEDKKETADRGKQND